MHDVIKGVHTMFYSSEPEATRAFLRDVIGLPAVDVGDGWLIFQLPEADMGVHPIDPAEGPVPGATHLSFYCDDIEASVARLEDKGVELVGGVEDQGWGLVTRFVVPGGFSVQLYQPKYHK